LVLILVRRAAFARGPDEHGANDFSTASDNGFT
jgi:hypothetical protein